MKKIGFFSGSFNPIHKGHLAIAEYMLDKAGLDEVWLSVSPQNPLKLSNNLLDDATRVAMVSLAIAANPRLRYCDIEMTLARPSYTITTLEALTAKYPDCEFHLLIGADNWLIFDHWKSYREIIERYPIEIYPRPGYTIDTHNLPASVRATEAPQMDISATEIRRRIAEGDRADALLPPEVYRYIVQHRLYL